MDVQIGVVLIDVQNAKDPGAELGDDRGKGCAEHAPMEHRHEQKVQHDIHTAGNMENKSEVLLLPSPCRIPAFTLYPKLPTTPAKTTMT